MKPLALLLLAILTALRFWLAAKNAVTPLEAYYWMCAHRLDLAFFDGPAGTAWLVRLGTLLGSDSAIHLRVAFPLFAAAATFSTWLLARSLFGPVAAIWAAIALNTLSFFNIVAIHAGPELPALTFTLLAAWAFVQAMDRGFPWWILAGALTALAAQFSYAAVLLVPGAALACALSFHHRAEWRRPGLYAMACLALAGLIPGIVWNQARDWPAFALGTLHTALTPRWGEIGPALGDDILQFSAVTLAALAFAIGLLARSARIHARPRLALCIAAPFLLLWIYGVLLGDPSAAALLPGSALLAGGLAHVFLTTPLLRRCGAALLVLIALSAIMPANSDPWTRSARGIPWHDVAATLDTLLARAQSPREAPLLLIAQDPDATAALNYHLAHTAHPEVFLRESQDVSNQFALWPRYDDFVQVEKPPDDFFKLEGSTSNPYMGRGALYLTDESPEDLPQTITAAFARVLPFAEITTPGARKFRVYLCEDYQTMPL